MNIYQVDYVTVYRGTSEEIVESVSVAANGDAQRAVNKAKKALLTEIIRYEDDNGKKCRSKRKSFRLVGVNKLASAKI